MRYYFPHKIMLTIASQSVPIQRPDDPVPKNPFYNLPTTGVHAHRPVVPWNVLAALFK